MSLRLDQRGDTIVEVIFSLVILSSVLVGALGLARNSRLNSENSLLRTQAANMVQEQYEALKSQRDNYPWRNFLNGSGNHGIPEDDGDVRNSSFENFNCDPTNPSDLVVGGPCYFHMERDALYKTDQGGSSNGADYGEWEACPGDWYPPLGIDNQPADGWNAGTNADDSVHYVNQEGGPGAYMFHSNSHGWVNYFDQYGPPQTNPQNPAPNLLGCRGNGRTQQKQPNINVKIYLDTVLQDPPCGIEAVKFTIVATWKQGGGNATNSLNLDALVGNVKGQPAC